MKSSNDDLRRRGAATSEDHSYAAQLSLEQQLLLLTDSAAPLRTAAAHQLGSHSTERETAMQLLAQLAVERCLYTRLAICQALEQGNQLTAMLMTAYLGEIGSNQYRTPPAVPSQKTSYPLPRDIIARTLGHMSPDIYPVLAQILLTGSDKQISEAIDAAGFLVFYQPELATTVNIQPILAIINDRTDQPLLLWKCLTCLSAFPLSASIQQLKYYSQGTGILAAEAQRSLKLLPPQ